MLKEALESRASLVLTGQFGANAQSSKPLLISSDPKLAFARVAALFSRAERRVGHDESSQIHLSAKIGEKTWIGPGVVIEEGASIGNHSSIEANSVIGSNVIIGEDVVVAAQTGISGSSRIGAGAIVGGQVGIADHVEIEAGVILGAQSGIPSNKVIRGKGVVFWGTPARPIKDYLKELATLSRLTRKKEE